MKIGINLVGVSYNDGMFGRYRNYEDAVGGFFANVVTPLRDEGHDIYFYLYSYDSQKKNDILNTYTPVKKSVFVDAGLNKVGGGDKLPNGLKVISNSYINSLNQLLGEDLDLVISTRYDINFFKNPFKEYHYDFTKCNFLWREPEFMHIPIVNDTFIVFPYSMTQNLINAIFEMEVNPPYGVGVAMHNIFVTMANQVGIENVRWVCDEFKTATQNNLYKLMRNE
jgi:hypothetical protein